MTTHHSSFRTHHSRKAYPAYKPSGVDWLGDVPEHWEVWKVTHGFDRLSSGTTPKSDTLDYYDGDVPWVTTSELRENLIEDTRNRLTEVALRDYSGLRVYPVGTLLFAMYGATIGRMGILGIPAAVNQACAAFTGPRHLTPEFTFYWLWMRRPTLIALSAGGGQPNLSQDDLRLVRIPAPPPVEQKAIAAFLDRETARIDALVEKKRRQIELLQEKRSALISHAVTKGLDPTAPMKDSGIEWLGDIPAHWAVGNIRRFAKMRTGHTPSRTNPDYWQDCTLPWFTLADVWQLRDGKRRYLGETKEMISELGLANSAAELLPKGTVVFSRTASVGFSGIMPQPMATSQDFWNWVCLSSLLPEYLLCLFRSMRQEFEAITRGSTHKTIYQPIAAGIMICVPPLNEQNEIAGYIDAETSRIDSLVQKVEQSIEGLRELRTSLISAAATGKIDVRGEG